MKAELNRLKDLAKQIIKNGEMDEYWLFVYECLTVGFLKEDWKPMKRANVSFLRSEYQ